MPLMPEWYFLIGIIGALSGLGLLWPPLLLLGPLFLLGLAATLIQAGVAAAKVPINNQPPLRRLTLRLLIGLFDLIQPLARLLGRICHGVGPWRRPGELTPPIEWIHRHSIWSEVSQPMEARLRMIEKTLLGKRAVFKRGGDYDPWDLEIRGGLLGCVRVVTMLEEHGFGKQLHRLQAWSRMARPTIGFILLFGLLAALAACDQAWLVALTLTVGGLVIAGVAWADCSKAMRIWRDTIERYAAKKTNETPLAEPLGSRLGSGGETGL
jgi:hypothetical protein